MIAPSRFIEMSPNNPLLPIAGVIRRLVETRGVPAINLLLNSLDLEDPLPSSREARVVAVAEYLDQDYDCSEPMFQCKKDFVKSPELKHSLSKPIMRHGLTLEERHHLLRYFPRHDHLAHGQVPASTELRTGGTSTAPRTLRRATQSISRHRLTMSKPYGHPKAKHNEDERVYRAADYPRFVRRPIEAPKPVPMMAGIKKISKNLPPLVLPPSLPTSLPPAQPPALPPVQPPMPVTAAAPVPVVTVAAGASTSPVAVENVASSVSVVQPTARRLAALPRRAGIANLREAARAAAAAAPEPEPSTEVPVLRGKRRQETQLTAGDTVPNVFVAETNLRESVRRRLVAPEPEEVAKPENAEEPEEPNKAEEPQQTAVHDDVAQLDLGALSLGTGNDEPEQPRDRSLRGPSTTRAPATTARAAPYARVATKEKKPDLREREDKLIREDRILREVTDFLTSLGWEDTTEPAGPSSAAAASPSDADADVASPSADAASPSDDAASPSDDDDASPSSVLIASPSDPAPASPSSVADASPAADPIPTADNVLGLDISGESPEQTEAQLVNDNGDDGLDDYEDVMSSEGIQEDVDFTAGPVQANPEDVEPLSGSPDSVAGQIANAADDDDLPPARELTAEQQVEYDLMFADSNTDSENEREEEEEMDEDEDEDEDDEDEDEDEEEVVVVDEDSDENDEEDDNAPGSSDLRSVRRSAPGRKIFRVRRTLSRLAGKMGTRARQMVDDLKVENLREALEKRREERKQRKQAREKLRQAREEREKARQELIAARWAQEQALLYEEWGDEAEQIILEMKAESAARKSRADIRAEANPYRRPRSSAPAPAAPAAAANGPLEALMTSMSLEGKTATASVDRSRDPRLAASRSGRPTAACFFKEK